MVHLCKFADRACLGRGAGRQLGRRQLHGRAPRQQVGADLALLGQEELACTCAGSNMVGDWEGTHGGIKGRYWEVGQEWGCREVATDTWLQVHRQAGTYATNVC